MPPSPLHKTVLAAFRSSDWEFSEVEGREVLRAGFEAHHTRVLLHVQSFPELPAVSVVAESCQATSDPAKRDRLAEAAMRVNLSLTVGNFEVDWDEGRLSFRATNLFPEPGGDEALIAGLVRTAVVEMDRISPVEAIIHRAEGPQLAALDLPALLRREDWLPDPPAPREG